MGSLPDDLSDWLDEMVIPDGTPYLLSPRFEYDVALNEYFLQVNHLIAPQNTSLNRARALKRFLDFLWTARGGRWWRDATEADHLAFHQWRRRDEAGPQVEGTTWGQEVTLVNQFYLWAVRKGHVAEVPIPQRARRSAPVELGLRLARTEGTVPATFAHDEKRDLVEWMPPGDYRCWRDVGLRGYGPDGLPTGRFRGRWASRNSAYTDLMIRTGMRISEQSSLALAEVPRHPTTGGFQRFWLPGVIAKYSSARWIYVPASVGADLTAYVEDDRADIVDRARSAGRYDRLRRPLVMEDPGDPNSVRQVGSLARRKLKLHRIGPQDRPRLLVDTPDGLEPAAFWLSELGFQMAVSSWEDVFASTNARCNAAGLGRLHCHAHLLRHSFAVITLEQLQRGHIAALAGLTPAQRVHHSRIFGDPLDWVRRRLGHRSILHTLIYLHALQELEMETRMALVPDTWEDPRATPLGLVDDDVTSPHDDEAEGKR